MTNGFPAGGGGRGGEALPQESHSWGLRSFAGGCGRENVGTAPRPHFLSVLSRLPGKGCLGRGEWGWKEHFLLRAVGRVCDFLSRKGNPVPLICSSDQQRSPTFYLTYC